MKIIQYRDIDVSYTSRKKDFHSAAKSALRKIATDLGLEKGSYDLRSNMGGIAVSGEVTLHHENIYIQIYQSCVRMGKDLTSILYRTCNGRKDYGGGNNNYMDISDLRHYENSLNKFKRCLG